MTRRMILSYGLLLATTGGASPAWATEMKVSIDNFTFSPPKLTVPAGTRVTWTNRDDIPHTIVGRDDPAALSSPVLDTGDSFSQTFEQPGRYGYFCSLHPHMQGEVLVR